MNKGKDNGKQQEVSSCPVNDRQTDKSEARCLDLE